MAESADDRSVDSLIDKLGAVLDELRSSQKKDVEDEISEESDTPREKQPSDLRDAAIRVRSHFRRSRKAAQAAEK